MAECKQFSGWVRKMSKNDQQSFEQIADYLVSEDRKIIHCTGFWTLKGLENLETRLENDLATLSAETQIRCEKIDAMDSAGAIYFQDLLENLKSSGKTIQITGLSEQIQSLLNLLQQDHTEIHQPPSPRKSPNILHQIGFEAYRKCLISMNFLAFTGEVFVSIFQLILHPTRIPFRATMKSVEEMGYRALAIVALLIFLVGVVLTYQIAVQLQIYNVDIFIVDISGMAVMREFGPLITAIIAAGRTSTALTSMIGTMKFNEEIDVLLTMGIKPVERLVMPRICGLLIAMPLLIVWADIFGILGSLLMARSSLGIGAIAFLERLQTLPVRHFWVGLIKAPIFALVIAAVGCFQGFQVTGTADSVGSKTTQSAVQSIFLIIIVDAFFSVVFSWQGI